MKEATVLLSLSADLRRGKNQIFPCFFSDVESLPVTRSVPSTAVCSVLSISDVSPHAIMIKTVREGSDTQLCCFNCMEFPSLCPFPCPFSVSSLSASPSLRLCPLDR